MGGERQIEVAGVRRTGSALALLRASHPEPTGMVTALAVALPGGTGRAAAGVVAAGAAVLAGQLSVGWHNDWLDAGRDAASGRPDKPVAAGDISPRPVARCAPWWALAAAGLLGCSAHLVNAVPDLADDLAAGVRGLPHMLGRSRSISATVVLLLAATVVESFGPGRPGWGAVGAMAGVAAVIAAGIVLARRPGSRWLFRAVLLAAAIDVAELVARGSRL